MLLSGYVKRRRRLGRFWWVFFCFFLPSPVQITGGKLAGGELSQHGEPAAAAPGAGPHLIPLPQALRSEGTIVPLSWMIFRR